MNDIHHKSFRKIFIHFNPELKSQYNNIIKPQISNVDSLFHFLNETNYNTYTTFFTLALEQYTTQCYYVKLTKQVHKELFYWIQKKLLTDIIHHLRNDNIYEIDFNMLVPYEHSWKLLMKLISKYDKLIYMNLSYSGITDTNVDEILTVIQTRTNKEFTLELKGITLNKRNIKSIRDIRFNPRTPSVIIIIDDEYNKRINVTWRNTKAVKNKTNYNNNN